MNNKCTNDSRTLFDNNAVYGWPYKFSCDEEYNEEEMSGEFSGDSQCLKNVS